MTNTTLDTIRSHVKQFEKPIKHPYLDNKGHVTIGAGRKVETKGEFVA